MNRFELIDFIKKQGVEEALLNRVEDFVRENPIDEAYKDRVPESLFAYYGKEIWTKALHGILSGYHILLSGPKATGKNVLSENLAQVFNRPLWNISLNVNSDSGALLGGKTFKAGEVVLEKGPVTLAAQEGGFAIFDEINMAKNESLSVVHSALDYRGIIDIPGYKRVKLSKATRFIGTMNYGYMGTRELNEALISRFLVIDMPILQGDSLALILREETRLREDKIDLFVRLLMDLQNKSLQGEISSKSVDIRGLFAALKMMEGGLALLPALEMGIINKSFDQFEREIVEDLILTLFSKDQDPGELFR